MTKKPHPSDIYEEKLIATATEWRVAFVKSPTKRFIYRCESEEQARTVARDYDKVYGANGRRACIYAIASNGRAYPLKNQER